MLSVLDIINSVYEKWADAIEPYVGDHIAMENSVVVNDLPFATMYFMGIPTDSSDLAGEESTINPTLQIDIYVNGQKALTTAYEIDQASHEALLGMGFMRSYGAELIQSTDQTIKRLTSRYTRVIGYGDNLNG